MTYSIWAVDVPRQTIHDTKSYVIIPFGEVIDTAGLVIVGVYKARTPEQAGLKVLAVFKYITPKTVEFHDHENVTDMWVTWKEE